MARKTLCYKTWLKLACGGICLLLLLIAAIFPSSSLAEEATQKPPAIPPSIVYGMKATQLGSGTLLFEIVGENLPNFQVVGSSEDEDFLTLSSIGCEGNIFSREPNEDNSSFLGFTKVKISASKTFTFNTHIPLSPGVEISMVDGELNLKFKSNQKLLMKQQSGVKGGTLLQFYIGTVEKNEKEDARKLKPKKVATGDPINNKTKISMDFRQIPLQDVLRFMASKLNLNFMVDSELENPLLTLKFDNSRFCDVFSFLVNTYKIHYTVIGKTLIVGTKENVARSAGRYVLREYPLYYASTKEVLANLREMFDFKNGITVNERLRTLYIRATYEDHVHLAEMITSLDKPSKQVMLEARLIEIDDEADVEVEKLISIVHNGMIASFSNHGGSARYTDYGGGVVPNVNPTGTTTQGALPVVSTDTSLTTPTAVVDHAMKMIDAGLRALESKDKGKILASPSVATLNGQKAVVKLTHNYLYQTGVDRSSNPQFQEQETGPTLEFTPIVGNDGYITIKITIKTGDIVAFRKSGISEVPETTKREATTQIRVRDGELFVLGGLYGHSKTKQTVGIPLISNIPLLGDIFKNTSTKDTKSQLAFIAIPHILSD